MLKAKGEIMFTVDGKNYISDQLRPAFMFAEGLLFSGNIFSNDDMYYHGQAYHVDIEFFTVNDEAYSWLKPILKDDMSMPMCAGRKILGISKLRDFEYISAQ